MGGERKRVVLDTNVLVSAIVFGGTPKKILFLILKGIVIGVISPALIAELSEVIHKKFPFSEADLEYWGKLMETDFELVKPRTELSVTRDIDDNRVLEAALAGGCDYIVTGDEDLLILKKYKKIKILTPNEFIEMV
jgi:putative PIN family toxin of toxin-antitoxin system